jgi:intermembrane space import and assembly protein 40
MQDCFRKHPEIYASELQDDEEEGEEELSMSDEVKEGGSHLEQSSSSTAAPETPEPKRPMEKTPRPSAVAVDTAQNTDIEDNEPVPKAAHDATSTQ